MGLNHAITYRAYYKTGGSWVAMPGVLSVDTFVESSDSGGPFRFGASVLPRATITCSPAAPATGWRRAPFRASIQVTIDGVAHPEEDIFTGLLVARRPGVSGPVFEAEGAEGFIRRAQVRTPLLEYRPLATATSVSSVEDPEHPSYAAGLLNRAFWESGGRPHAQAVTYPGARFYYACDGTSVAPEYSWFDSDNTWDESLKLAEHAGGQIYQDSRGVMRYVNPLALAESVGGALVIADTGPHASGRVLYDGQVEPTEDLAGAYNVAVCQYQRRALQPPQVVYDGRDHFDLEASDGDIRDLATQWPCRWRDPDGVAEYSIKIEACYDTGEQLTPLVTVLEESAKALRVSITNPDGAQPIHISRITVTGRPVTVLQEGVARYTGPRFDANGEEDVEIRLNDNVSTQRDETALRRARLAVTFDGYPRPVWRVQGCPYMPGVTVGQYALFYSARLGLSAEPVRIVGQAVERSGRTMALSVASVSGLPRLSERFVIGQAYADSDVRRLGL